MKLENDKMTVLRYEVPDSEFLQYPAPYIFLAGPTVRGHQQHLQPSWRFAAIDIFRNNGFNGTLIVPEFTDITKSDKGIIDIPMWEYEGLKLADCIMFWVPRTRELIGLTTNCEFGYWISRRRRVVYGRPDDAYRIDYLDFLWERDYTEYRLGSQVIHHTLEDTIHSAMTVAKVEGT